MIRPHSAFLRARRWLLPAVVALVCAGCARQTADEARVLARVGPTVITADEFVMNYEFGFAHLKTSENPKRAYLQRMIDERLLATAARRLGLDRDPEIRQRLESLREKLLVEAVFKRQVNDKVTVSDEEVRRLMQRDAVRFKLRTLPAATRAEASRLRVEAVDRGMENVLAEFLEGSELAFSPDRFESPYLAAHEVEPELLAAVQDVPVGEISAPIPYRGSYLLVQVLDVRREPVPVSIESADAVRYREVVFQQKAKERAGEFIRGRMAPLDVRLKGPVFNRLERHLWAWFEQTGTTELSPRAIAATTSPAADSLRALREHVLFTTKDETWTVGRFLDEMPADRYPLSDRSPEIFRSDLYDAVGLTLRDRAFVADAEKARLDETEQFEREYRIWSDKWLFRAMLERVRADADHHLDRVVREAIRDSLDALRTSHEVWIDEDLLASLQVSPARSAGPNVMLMERHSGMPAVPVVDPWWHAAAPRR